MRFFETGPSAEAWTTERRDASLALFAAFAYNPTLLAPMRKLYKELWQRVSDDGLALGVSQAVPAVIHGIWFCWVLLGLRKSTNQLVEDMRIAVESLLEEQL